MNETVMNEIQRRRTFAIISHPDAGKTTMTEKLLLYGGAIHMAGSVKARKAAHLALKHILVCQLLHGLHYAESIEQRVGLARYLRVNILMRAVSFQHIGA